MNKTIYRITGIIMALSLTFGIFNSGRAKSMSGALMSGGIVNLAFFYKPPSNSDAATVAGNFDAVILTGGDESFRDQLVAKGFNSTIIQYFGAIGIQDPGSCTSSTRNNQVAYKAGDFCSISENHPDWFLLDSNGQRVLASPGSDTYRMDPGNPGWRNFFVTRVLEWQEKSGWSGLFLDNLEASLSDIQKNGITLAKYPDDASYHAAILGFLQYLNANYSQPYDRPIVANIISRRDEATWFSYMQYLDGAMQERWAVDWSLDKYVSESKWKSDMALAEKTQSQGKYIILRAPGNQTDVNRHKFAFASYLLISNGKAAFRYSSGIYREVWLYSDYQVDLGIPLGPRHQSGGLWRRDFTKGFVTVDPVNHTATISTDPSTAASPTPLMPTATPTTILPTATPVQPTAVPSTQTPVPAATNTQVPNLLPTQTPVGTNIPAATSTQPPSISGTLTFTPAADAYVTSAIPNTNYGGSQQIRFDANPVVNGYLAFNVQGLSAPITSVKLRIYANSSSSSGFRVYGVANTSWEERSITYNTAPPLGNQVGSSGAFKGSTWITVDVTNLVTGNGVISLALTGMNSTAVSLASRETGAKAPQLIITTR